MSLPRFGLPLRFALLLGGYLVALFAFEWRTATELEARVVDSERSARARVAPALPEGALDEHRGQMVDLQALLRGKGSITELAAEVCALLDRDPLPAWLEGAARASTGLLRPQVASQFSDELLRAARHEASEGSPQRAVRWARGALQVLWVSDTRHGEDAVDRSRLFQDRLSRLVDDHTFDGEAARLLQEELDPWLRHLAQPGWVEDQLVGMVPRVRGSAPRRALFTRSELARTTLSEWRYVEQLADATRRPFGDSLRDSWGHVEPEVGQFWGSQLMQLAQAEVAGLAVRRQVAMARIAIASRVYRFEHGEPPVELASLAGYLGGEVPLDPATGADFVVGRTRDGARCVVAPPTNVPWSGIDVIDEQSMEF